MIKKKYIALFCVLALTALPVTACSNGDQTRIVVDESSNKELPNEETDTDRTVSLKELGLKYTTPELWKKYEETNIYPETVTSEGFFAQIKYSFLTEEELKALNDPTASVPLLNSNPVSICQIVVLEKANLETVGVQSVFSEFDSNEKLGEQGEYVYYLLYGHNGDKSKLTAEQLKAYEEIMSVVPELQKSIQTFPFDPSELNEASKKLENTLTFSTTTLEGEEVNSTIFAAAEVTMFNFGATYAHDESAALQELYNKIQATSSVKMNLITAYIDTPEATTTETGKELRNNANAKYKTLVMDEMLANWATNHLGGVPTTVFVDVNGQIIGESIEGAKTADEYFEAMTSALESSKK